MMQTIHIHQLWCDAVIGVYPHEREAKQPLCLTIEVQVDASQAIASDDIRHTVDYDSLSRVLKQHSEQASYQLLETLLAKLLDELKQFELIHSARIDIAKPHALEHIGAHVSLSGGWERGGQKAV